MGEYDCSCGHSQSIHHSTMGCMETNPTTNHYCACNSFQCHRELSSIDDFFKELYSD